MTRVLRSAPLRCGAFLALALAAVAADAGTESAAADPPADQPVSAKGPTAMFGGSVSRNMANLTATNIPGKFDIKDKGVLLWKADLGSKAYGGPTVAGGRVFVGTNNQRPRNDRDVQRNKAGMIEPVDKGILMCFDEKTGTFQWQAVHDKLESGRVNDWPEEGVCATPTVEGDRVYYVSNRCTVMCLDAKGFADGNQGFQGEKYKDKTDADVIWQYDMMKELKVFPHNMSAGCPLIVGDLLFVHTANGVDDGHLNLPSPNAPSFIALNKNTGALVWKSSLPGKNIMHGQWSNATYAEIDGVRQVIFGGGDGWLYSFVPETGELIWKFDGNPKDSEYVLGGAGTRSDYIGTPVVYDNKIYIGLGQDPEHSSGISHFWCIAPKNKKGDISKFLEVRTKGEGGKEVIGETPNPNSGVVWHFGGEETRKFAPREFKFGRTMSTACVVDDVLYISELAGYLHCMNAQTGEHYWKYDTKAAIWGSAYYADGKVYLATDGCDLFVFKHEKKPTTIDELAGITAIEPKAARKEIKAKQQQVADKYLIAKNEFDAPIRSTPLVANGVLYVMTENTLYAIKQQTK